MSKHLLSDHQRPGITTSALTARLKKESTQADGQGVAGVFPPPAAPHPPADQLISGLVAPPPAAYGLELGGGTHRKSPPSV